MKMRLTLARSCKGLLLAIGILGLISTSACKPRGESKSLQDVVQTAQSRYRKAFDGSSFPEKVDGRLKEVTSELEALLKGSGDEKGRIGSVVSHLRALIGAAGYTSRPAFGELIDQFSAFQIQSEINKDALALVVARTFFLLASELEGVRFQLYERELKK